MMALDNSLFHPNTGSLYIDESQLNDFFDFQCTTAFNMIHINCRSLNKNYCDIVSILEILSKPLTAIVLTETWLTTTNQDTFPLPGYNFLCLPRKDKSGGGVGIYVNSAFVYKLRQDLCRMNSFIECLFIEIVINIKTTIIIGSIYRPPNSDIVLFNSEVVSILKIMDSEVGKLGILAGDFNLDLIKFESHEQTAEFLNNILSYSYYPTIRYPTRITDNSATLIDNIFLKASANKVSSAIVYSDISDHLPIVLHLNAQITKSYCSKAVKKRFFTDNH